MSKYVEPKSDDKEDPLPKSQKPKQKSAKSTEGSKTKFNTGRWSNDEHSRFMEAIELFGKDWKRVQQHVGTRTSAQSRSHAQKVLDKSELGPNNYVACTPQKKLQPLEVNFAEHSFNAKIISSKDNKRERKFSKIDTIKKQVVSPFDSIKKSYNPIEYDPPQFNELSSSNLDVDEIPEIK